MKRLLVGSVFAPTSRNPTWYKLQIDFLKATVGDDFDHVVYLNRVPPELFAESTVIGAVPPSHPYEDTELDVAIAAILAYFERHLEYDYYLILDSDAFPFRQHWIDELVALMKPVPEVGLPRRFMAAPVRAENLDGFPHACVFFIDGDYLRATAPGTIRLVSMSVTNFAGFTLYDLGFDDSLARDPSGAQLWLPLIRTNTWNPHPIVSAVYGHMFYHHGAGSRAPRFRVVQCGIFRHYLSNDQLDQIEENLFDRLGRDPQGLCLELAAPATTSIERTAAASTEAKVPRWMGAISTLWER